METSASDAMIFKKEVQFYRVRFRHSGMELVDDESHMDTWSSEIPSMGEQELLEKVGNHKLTHLAVEQNLPSSVYLVAPELTHLSVCHADITTLESVSRLQKLEKLDLSCSSSISSKALDTLSSLRGLRVLDLRQCKLTTLPESLSGLHRLEKLDLACNQLVGLNFLSSLQSLRELDLSDCGLQTLPADGLSRLQKLEKLDLSCNEFKSPKLLNVLSSLQSITELSLSRCRLKFLPDSLAQLRRLENLDLSGNRFKSSETLNILSSLESLKEIDLSQCRLDTIPESLSQLQRLEKLNLSGNQFISADVLNNLSSLQSLRDLSLAQCGLDSLSDSLQSLQTMRVLDLHSNNFTGLPPCVCKLMNLEMLVMGSNLKLQSLSRDIVHMTRLQSVNVDSCTFLESPPLDICAKGLEAIKEFYAKSDNSNARSFSKGKLHLSSASGATNSQAVYRVLSTASNLQGGHGVSDTSQLQGVCHNVSDTLQMSNLQRMHRISNSSRISDSQEAYRVSNAPMTSNSLRGHRVSNTFQLQGVRYVSDALLTANLQQLHRVSSASVTSSSQAVHRVASQPADLTSQSQRLAHPVILPSVLPNTVSPPSSDIAAAAVDFKVQVSSSYRSIPSTQMGPVVSSAYSYNAFSTGNAMNLFRSNANLLPHPQVRMSTFPYPVQPSYLMPSYFHSEGSQRFSSSFLEDLGSKRLNTNFMPSYQFPPQTAPLSLVKLNTPETTAQNQGFVGTTSTYQTLSNVPSVPITSHKLERLPATLSQPPWPPAASPFRSPPVSPTGDTPPYYYQCPPRPPLAAEIPPAFPGPAVPGPSREPLDPAGPSISPPPPQYSYDGLIRGATLKLTLDPDGRRMIFPFIEVDTVDSLIEIVNGSSDVECSILDTDGSEYSGDVQLYMVATPFIFKVGEVSNRVTESEERKRKLPPIIDSEDEEEERCYSSKSKKSKKKNAMFGIVSTPQQAVELMSYIHKEMTEKSFSINKVLKMVNKDRKTVDRFRNIYYLHVLDPDKLKELESQWKANKKLGGLFKLDEMAKDCIDIDQVKQMAGRGELTIFGEAALRT